jgi:deoxyribose-phosphate aldolase
VKVVTVISFPHGNDLSSSKALASQQARNAGADEIDMVMNLGWAKEGNWPAIESDIAQVVKAVKPTPVKVILETCLLSQEQIQKACHAAFHAGAKFVKTSTGYSTAGATIDVVRLMKASIPSTMEVKASGGIRDLPTALAMIEAGATRLGTSSGAAIISGKGNSSTY